MVKCAIKFDKISLKIQNLQSAEFEECELAFIGFIVHFTPLKSDSRIFRYSPLVPDTPHQIQKFQVFMSFSVVQLTRIYSLLIKNEIYRQT